jgi:hypothetical protein
VGEKKAFLEREMKRLLIVLTLSLGLTGCDFTNNRTLKNSWGSGISASQNGGNGFTNNGDDNIDGGNDDSGSTGGGNNDGGNEDSGSAGGENNDGGSGNDDEVSCEEYKSGLKAGLYALKTKYINRSNRRSIRSLLNLRKLISIDYFTAEEVNTPNRNYAQGVVGREAEYIIDPRSGNELLENYIIKYQGQIVVNDKRDEGKYEFALLSDDGVILKLDNKRIIQTNKVHAVRFSKGRKKINMKINKPVNLDLYYYQGPKNHVANVLLWRKVDNKRYHRTCSKERYTTNLDQLKLAGWKVVGKENFRQKNNECHYTTLPYIDEK